MKQACGGGGMPQVVGGWPELRCGGVLVVSWWCPVVS